MRDERTLLVLGAGASYCYEDGSSNIPTQKDILGRLFFGADTGGGEGFPSFTGPAGPKHSFALGQMLRQLFNLPEVPGEGSAKMDFWRRPQDELGYDLESLYTKLDSELPLESRGLLDDFKAVIRTAILEPVADRKPNRICRYHRMICEWLEPGDYIVNFNWDSLMADALLYSSHFWFPMTGFGYSPIRPMLEPGQKKLPVDSLVELFHVHGSVLLFELDEELPPGSRVLLYHGPVPYDPLGAFLELEGVDLAAMQAGGHSGFAAREENREAERRLLGLGHLRVQGKWYKPVFVAPSRNKREYSDWYFRGLKRYIHARLPFTQRIVIAGYSFPAADYEYLKHIFLADAIPEKTVIKVVNPSNEDEEFCRRVRGIFNRQTEFDFSVLDFREFCRSLGPEQLPRDSPGS